MATRLFELVKNLADERDSDTPPAEDGTDTGLYVCPDCSTTYISDGMESCPDCGDAVTAVPTERDLGFG